MKTTMYRQVNFRIRYYTIELYQNLFEEWMVVRTFGSIKRANPTGCIYEACNTRKNSETMYWAWIAAKKKKGYQSKHEMGEKQ